MKINAEEIARAFHEAYERLAPSHGYETRKASAVPWEDVPENNRALMTAVAAEVVPLIAAQVLRAYADSAHPTAEGIAQRTEYGTGIEYDTICTGCGASWNSDEGGCTERVELIRAANELVTPPICNCHETGAPCNCEDGRERPPACPTCGPPVRETVGMVCQTCGTDYAADTLDAPTRGGHHGPGRSLTEDAP